MGIKEIVPLLAAVIGLTPVILKWFSDRSKEAATRRTMQHSKEQVEFWQTWLKAQREVTSDERFAELKNEVSERLDKLMELNIEQEKSKTEEENNKDELSFVQKIFLSYLPRNASGWILHTFYYITVSFIVMFLYSSSLTTGNEVYSEWATFSENMVKDLDLFIFIVVVAFILQRLARRVDRKYKAKLKTQETE